MWTVNFRQRAVFGGCNAWKEGVRWGVWNVFLEADGENGNEALFHPAGVVGRVAVHRKDNDIALRMALMPGLDDLDPLETSPGILPRWDYYSMS
jgi:hypothetical protein